MNTALLNRAWKRIVLAFVAAFAFGLVVGIGLTQTAHLSPQSVYAVSTKRLSYAFPVFELGARAGIDPGILVFAWNALGALATISFIFTGAWFNPQQSESSPRALRKFFCSKRKMKLLCFLPGCRRIEAEAVRRLYVWLMVPLIGMVLLGMESGLSVSTAPRIFGSYFIGMVSLLPHGIFEIPAFALAGAVAYSAHLLIAKETSSKQNEAVFDALEAYRKTLPIKKIALLVIGGLLVAALIEAHVTPLLLNHFWN
jgi:Stage II sporulation protein M